MTLAQLTERNGKHELYNEEFSLYSQPKLAEHSASYLTRRSLDLLRLLSEGGVRKTVQVYEANQTDLASKLGISRQALSLQLRKLKERKLIQIGRGFISLTEEGLRAVGCNITPTIVTIRIAPQKRAEAVEKIKTIPAIQIFRVTGQVDVVLILEQQELNHVLTLISSIDGVLETQCFISIETIHQNDVKHRF
jgi:DNA-binding Lrp family transcriptional regulator